MENEFTLTIAMLAVATSLAVPFPRTGKMPCVAYDSFKFGKAYFHQVQVDLSAGATQLKMVHYPHLTSVRNLVDPQMPIFAITGTFFAPKNQVPVADVLVKGRLVAQGNRGSGMAVDYDGNVKIFDERFRQQFDWTFFEYGLRGAVRVVSRSVVCPNPQGQRFRDPAIWGRAARTALGMTKSGKLVAFATRNSVSLSELGKAMVSRGITEGISLDGGSSTCFYYNGTYLIPTARRLCNMVVLTPKR